MRSPRSPPAPVETRAVIERPRVINHTVQIEKMSMLARSVLIGLPASDGTSHPRLDARMPPVCTASMANDSREKMIGSHRKRRHHPRQKAVEHHGERRAVARLPANELGADPEEESDQQIPDRPQHEGLEIPDHEAGELRLLLDHSVELGLREIDSASFDLPRGENASISIFGVRALPTPTPTTASNTSANEPLPAEIVAHRLENGAGREEDAERTFYRWNHLSPTVG